MMRCMLTAVEASEVLEVPEVMRCMLRSTLYAGGCGGRALFTGGAGRDALCATPYVRDVQFSKFSLWQFYRCSPPPKLYGP